MTRKDLLKLVQDEVTSVFNGTLREPEIRKPKPKHRPAMQSDDEIEEFWFYGGDRPKEEKEKAYKKLLTIGKN